MTHPHTSRWATRAVGLALAMTVGGAAVTGTVAAQTPAPAPPAVSPAAPAAPTAPAAPATPAAPAPAGDAAGNPTQQQADPHKDDLLVPDWLMLVIAVALVAGAVSLATQSYIRFSRTRRELEG